MVDGVNILIEKIHISFVLSKNRLFECIVMHDEASAHYVSMIDQTSLGHKFLKEEFGYTPTVGWQIDPFGHSNTHAWLSSAVGFDSLFFGRIDYQDHDNRMAEKTMEMIWKVPISSLRSS